MHIINARLRNREGLHDLHLEHGRIASITPHTTAPAVLSLIHISEPTRPY